MPYPVYEYKGKKLDITQNSNNVISVIADIDNTHTTPWVHEILGAKAEWKGAHDAMTPLVNALKLSSWELGLKVIELRRAGEIYSTQLKEIKVTEENKDLAKAIIILSLGLAVRQLIKKRKEVFQGGLESALTIAKNDIFKEDPTIQAILNGTATFCTNNELNNQVKKAISEFNPAPSLSSCSLIAKDLKVDVGTIKSTVTNVDSPATPILPPSSSSSQLSSPSSKMSEGVDFFVRSVSDLEGDRNITFKEIIKLQEEYDQKQTPELKTKLDKAKSEYKDIVDLLRDHRVIQKGLQIEQEFLITDVKPALDALKKSLEPGRFSYLYSLTQKVFSSSGENKDTISNIKNLETSSGTVIDLLSDIIRQLEEASKNDSRIAKLPPEASIEKFKSLLKSITEKVAPYAEKTINEPEENVSRRQGLNR
ncbi:MAG: hypothetical protein JO131_04050 [Gammaproteobacteria bacterium]|nr:hypothetical protein [Gammaproteobacteria bacterium]